MAVHQVARRGERGNKARGGLKELSFIFIDIIICYLILREGNQ